jgi:hypothetical protein
LITTRANLVIGEEIRYNELTSEQTKSFLAEVVSVEFPTLNPESFKRDLSDPEILKEVHQITNGRPLFIYQFVHVWMQAGTIPRALRTKISTNKDAIEFLYGRIYDYFSETAKNMFAALNLIVSTEDLIGVVDKVRYVLNLEDDKERFDVGMQELVKLRVLELLDGGLLQVYSREIYEIMGSYFMQRPEGMRRSWQQRVMQIGKDKKLENDRALLSYANSARYSRSEEEVKSLYRQILNRTSASPRTKLQAGINLASYFFLDRGNKEEGVKVLEDYAHLLSAEASFVKLRGSFNWAIGSKEKAIAVLADSIDDDRARRWTKDERVEILGLLLTYKSIYWLQRREELKNKEAVLDEARQVTNKREWGEQKTMFESIVNKHGRQLLDLLKTLNVKELTAAARQNTVTGLPQPACENLSLRRKSAFGSRRMWVRIFDTPSRPSSGASETIAGRISNAQQKERFNSSLVVAWGIVYRGNLLRITLNGAHDSFARQLSHPAGFRGSAWDQIGKLTHFSNWCLQFFSFICYKQSTESRSVAAGRSLFESLVSVRHLRIKRAA